MADYVSLIVGGSFALGGAYLAPFMQSRQRHHEAKLTRIALTRTKAEELFVIISEVRANARGMARRTVDRGTAVALPEGADKYFRMTALSLTYFPETHCHFDAYRTAATAEMDKIRADREVESAETLNDRLVEAVTVQLVALCYKVEDELINIVKQAEL